MKQAGLDLGHELVVDLFAGGGGASCGIEQGIGRPVDIGVNHDPMAITMHQANHPQTRHFCESVFKVNPVEVTGNQPVGLLWASPDCTHHSKAKGGKPVSAKRRGLAWVVVKWARRTRPRVIMLENVEEFQDWGPVIPKRGPDGEVVTFPDGKPHLIPCPERKGQEFRKFVAQLERLGYQVEWRQLRACDYGAPTIRKRLFMIARRDGRKIIWPKPSHGPVDSLPVKRGRAKPYRTAAECIDWSIPCPSIFTRKRPLAENTLRRIAQGMKRFVIDAEEPFIVNADASIIVHTLIAIDHGSARSGCSWSAQEPLTTITTENRHALVTAFLAKHYTGVVGTDLRKPLSTVTTVDHHSLVAAFMAPYYGSGSGETGRDLRQPAPTATTKDRLQLITVQIDGATYVITDIGMRMLKPHELFMAQGFPADYVISPEFNGKPIPGYAQVRMCGNSVPPVWPRALVEANFAHEKKLEATA
ncbi:DNA cytosine methyltransferase [Marinobacter pelagius]|uniref:DNA (cytosine-5-)-methyltransferase n=1 Tax=Marinobacter pelagius TaxID=379482 RepID=A0A1I4T6Q3_9GAMM|nr:DNA cytosine methyltransferase [Marinobacter pelagius]SFM72311.1 DNA (cytosine-5)-methyltransferase 1 [Marinobacter pelagius]